MTNLVVFAAHPDDETVLAGGTLALCAERGWQVHLLIATRGEGGDLGKPPLCSRTELGDFRARELRCASMALGAASLTLLGYVDPTVGPGDELYAFEHDYRVLVDQISSHIKRLNADVVISHGSSGEYGHPAHLLMHAVVREACEQTGRGVLFYSFAAQVPNHDDHILNENDPAHLALDIRPWLDQKEAAALCHRTQHALFTRRHPGASIREVMRFTESFHRHQPPVEDGSPQDPFADLLIAAGAWTPGAAR